MEALFWGCFITGILFTLVTLLFGEILSGWADSLQGHPIAFLQPVVVVGGLTAFGGSGTMLLRYTDVGSLLALMFAMLIALVLSVITWFVYVKPMRQSENSTAFSMRELTGKIAEVTVPIPQHGYGEVMVKVGAGFTNQIAASLDGTWLVSGSRVVIVEVKEDVLFVALLE
ncbi:putative membrane protein YuaF [compost metagenome]